MKTAENFPWIPFYTNFADALVPYQHKRDELIEKLVAVFASIDMKFPTLEKDGLPEDMDPFTVFALFNKNNTNDKRQAIIRGLKAAFDVAGEVPDDFPGIPILDPRSAAFYGFRGNRGEKDIENLWKIFLHALDLSARDMPQNREAFCVAFDQAEAQNRIKWNLTMGLFWIRPYAFLNLDGCNQKYLRAHLAQFPFLEKAPATIFKSVPNGSTYLSLCDDFKTLFSSGHSAYSSFPDLSRKAWFYSQRHPAPTPPSPAPQPQPPAPQPVRGDYTREDFLDEVFLEAHEYDALVRALKHKKNLILQGPPGVGKTFVAKRLAYALAGRKDTGRVKAIQFHQNMSYEDFIMGFRPTESGFELKPGVFYTFCNEAEKEKDTPYFLIIDEINRGNTSKIFGDMFMLLENDKREPGNEVQLLYKDEKFSIPENLYIIGTMNTADRSLAMLDYALRRRFAFYDLKPAFGTGKFVRYAENLESAQLDALIEVIRQLNAEISQDPALGEGFCIGHSYFSNWKKGKVPAVELRTVVEQELIPLVREYWYDDRAKAAGWSEKLRAALQ